jgi:hypothetical protein
VPQLTLGRLNNKQEEKHKKKEIRGEGSYLPNLPLEEEAPGHEPTGLRIKNIKHINN